MVQNVVKARTVGDQLQRVLFSSQKVFCLFKIFDIRIGSEPSDDLSVLVALRLGAEEKPPISAVMAA
jgi:hypothetical protein